MELILTTDITAIQPIEFNFEEIKSALNLKLEKYRNLIVDEDGVPDAKKDRAELNKLSDSINAERIKIKKQYLEPYDKFEAKLKELTSLIAKPCDEIDKAIKHHEECVRENKREEIKRIYNESIGDLSSVINLERLYDKKWENVSVKILAVTEQIQEKIANINSDIATIKSMTLKHETAVLGKYIDTLSLASALSLNAQLIAVENATKPVVTVKVGPVTYPPQYEEPPTEAEDEPPTDEIVIEPRSSYNLQIYASPTQLAALKQYLTVNKIIHSYVKEQCK